MGIVAPFVEKGGEVGREVRVELHPLACAGMGEAEGFGMEGLTRTEVETVADKLHIRRGALALEGDVAAIAVVVEEGVAYMAHVDADLMGAAGLELAFDKGAVGKALKDAVVGDGMLGVGVLGLVIDGKEHTVAGVARKGAIDGALVLFHNSPDKGVVGALSGLVEKLKAEIGLGSLVFGNQKEA